MATSNSMIANPTLADDGRRRLEWVRERMPILKRLKNQLTDEKPFAGMTIGICLHVEAKTAIWLEALRAGGATIALTGSPGTTQDDVAAALADDGVFVYSQREETFSDHLEYCRNVLQHMPDLISDNGADLHFLIHRDAEFANLLETVKGATEETTSGGFRLREDLREQAFPTIVINDSRAKRIIENRYGVGLSVVDGLMRTTNMMINGLSVAVIGYGYCGRGVALCLRNLGAHVSVVEIDPLTALDAHLEGFRIVSLDEAIAESAMVVTVTGRDGILKEEHFSQLRNGALLVNAGHFEFEIDVEALRTRATSARVVRNGIEAFELPNGRKVFLLAGGRPINLAGGDGNPIEVMDLGLALQTLSLAHLAKNSGSMKHIPQNVPADVERAVSEMALNAWRR